MLFDYGLVLTGPAHPPAWEAMKAVLAADEGPFHAAYWCYRHDYDRGALTGPDYWNAAARDLRRQLTEPEMHRLIEADIALWTEPNAPMIAWAARLQAAGVRTGILSNLGDAMETGVLRSCAWMNGFAHHTFSHRLGIAKPEPAIYAHAAKGLGVPASAVLFLDDREENVRGAAAAGMQAMQYLDHGEFVQEFAERGYAAYLPAPDAG